MSETRENITELKTKQQFNPLTTGIGVTYLLRDLEHFKSQAEQAIKDDQIEIHVRYIRKYHQQAKEIMRLTGVDPREEQQ